MQNNKQTIEKYEELFNIFAIIFSKKYRKIYTNMHGLPGLRDDRGDRTSPRSHLAVTAVSRSRSDQTMGTRRHGTPVQESLSVRLAEQFGTGVSVGHDANEVALLVALVAEPVDRSGGDQQGVARRDGVLLVVDPDDVLPGDVVDFVFDFVGVFRDRRSGFELVLAHPEIRRAVGLVEHDGAGDAIGDVQWLVLHLLVVSDDGCWLLFAHTTCREWPRNKSTGVFIVFRVGCVAMSEPCSRLDSRSTIVTGAASGIGRAIADRFASEGASVTIADIDETNGRAVAEAFRRDGHDAHFQHTDVTDRSEVRELIRSTVDRQGGLDVFVNNAGGHFGGDKLHTVSLEDFQRNIDLNLRGTFLCSREALPYMIENGGGAFVHIASVAGQYGCWAPAYSAAKGGVIALSRLIATQYGTHGIRSNAVCPGIVETDGKRESMSERGGDPLRDEWLAQFPLGRLGRPEDVAAAAAFLASDDASFVSGTELVVDGGSTAGFDHDIEQMAFDIEAVPTGPGSSYYSTD